MRSKEEIKFRVKSSSESSLIAHAKESAEKAKQWPEWKRTILGSSCKSKEGPEDPRS